MSDQKHAGAGRQCAPHGEPDPLVPLPAPSGAHPPTASSYPADEFRDGIELDRFLPPFVDRERDSEFLDRLGESLLKQGFMHPIRCMREIIDNLEFYRTLTGWSRVLAGRRVGIRKAPALIINRKLDETEILLDTSIENHLRAETKEIDQYRIYTRLRELNGWTLAEIARACHTSASELTKTFSRCEKLPEDLVAIIGNGPGRLCPRGAYSLSRLHPDADKQRELAKKNIDGLLKVERLEEQVAKLLGTVGRKAEKPIKASADGVKVEYPGDWNWQRMLEWTADRLLDAIKRGAKLGEVMPPSALQRLLKSS